ncbi:MAG: hypothetical protein WCF84_25125 [Anaerolineae bacterium]
MSNSIKGTITLMGSGEMADSMSRVHRKILTEIQEPVRPVFIDTPAGFELNADEISAKAVEYFAQRFALDLQVVRFKNKAQASAIEVEAAVRNLRRANYIFAGPGSPSYAIRNWRDTLVWETVLSRWMEGAHLVLASAAAITSGCTALPVYEIYKAGQDPHWIPGLHLLGQLSLSVAVIPHWNNSEGGTFDTRFCYMGAPRLQALERELDPATMILGIDEYTACTLDPNTQQCTVMGAGQVTVHYRDREWNYPAGVTFGFDRLRTEPLRQLTSGELPAEETGASDNNGPSVMAGRYLQQLASALTEAHEGEVQRDLIDQAHGAMHELSAEWIAPAHTTGGQDIAPLVELLIELRSSLRGAKQYALADQVRQGLMQLGIQIQDTPNGTTWTQVKE